ncbi:SDR family oxidoreductase [Luteolibacter ambystomatis]|uniref:SDR family oxidoreductase n=1 Tax=Luteolibacter ambystomatis TaxID=2824561 RepID=A0A975G7M1_9BACT|nr:UDP-glucuronic acid decarboxylase family protein [Luteolibacter ambystomatis]QUE50256.1 SDR family oxidoreductase [Luteolibacter ambystomatis]
MSVKDSALLRGKTAVVTGGAGFVPSHLVERLLADGLKVIALDNFVTGHRRNIEHLIGNPDFQFIEQDVSESFEIEGPVDFVFHMASPASPIDYVKIPLETLKAGSYASHNALELARVKGATYLVASTSEVYGDPEIHPQPEGYWGNVNPVGVRSCYDEAKRYAEAVTMAYHRAHGVDTKIVRIFNTYGPRMRLDDGRVVPAFIGQALRGEPMTMFGGGGQTRSFCYVSDLVEGIWKLARSNTNDPVNIGNPHEMTIYQFGEAIARHFDIELEVENRPMPPDDPKVRKPDIARAKDVLHWEPVVSFDDGIARTIEYFRGVVATV